MIPLQNIPDFALAVLKKYERDAFTDLALKYRNKCAKMYMDDSRFEWSSGDTYNFKVRVASEKNFRWTAPYSKDSTNIVSLLKSAEVPWSHATTNMSWDMMEKEFQTDNAQQTIDYFKVKTYAMFEDFWDGIEEAFFEKPVSSTQNPLPMTGLAGPIVKNGAVAEGALNGGDPAGFASGYAGLTSAEFPNWQNWTFAHDGTVTQEFVDRLWTALVKTNFQSTHPFNSLVTQKDVDDVQYIMYTTLAMLKEMVRFLKAQNDNLGNDVAAMYSTAVPFNGNLVKEADYLTTNYTGAGTGNDPVYGINKATYKFARKRGRWMQKKKAYFLPDAHTTWIMHMDSSVASVCYDRRSNFVGHRVA